VRIFLLFFALAYIAALFLASAGGHVLRLKSFRQLIQEHRIVSAAPAGLIAAVVCGFELSTGWAALFSLGQFASSRMRISVLISAALAGSAFWLYVRQLLRKPTGVTSCGCSPLAAPLTRASLAPSIGVVCISACGLAAIGGASYHSPGVPVALPCLWGAAFAGITVLYPAAVLQLPNGREA
jgi:hypothetical protein